METAAKQVVQCDNCKQRMLPEENQDDVHLQAKLKGPQGKDEDRHFCDEECLRIYLNKRAKRARASTMKFVRKNRSWEIDLIPSVSQ